MCLFVCLSFCGQVPVCLFVFGQVSEIDRHASIDLLPYSKLYVQPGLGTYSHVRVSVCLSLSVFIRVAFLFAVHGMTFGAAVCRASH